MHHFKTKFESVQNWIPSVLSTLSWNSANFYMKSFYQIQFFLFRCLWIQINEVEKYYFSFKQRSFIWPRKRLTTIETADIECDFVLLLLLLLLSASAHIRHISKCDYFHKHATAVSIPRIPPCKFQFIIFLCALCVLSIVYIFFFFGMLLFYLVWFFCVYLGIFCFVFCVCLYIYQLPSVLLDQLQTIWMVAFFHFLWLTARVLSLSLYLFRISTFRRRFFFLLHVCRKSDSPFFHFANSFFFWLLPRKLTRFGWLHQLCQRLGYLSCLHPHHFDCLKQTQKIVPFKRSKSV